MKYRNIIILLFIMCCVKAKAQNDFFELKTDQYKKIKISADFDLSSDLNNDFITTFYKQGKIDNDLKQRNKDRLNAEKNSLGMYFDFETQYIEKPAKLFNNSNLGYTVALESHLINEALFTKDAFEIIFYGNKNFVGKPADFNKIKYNNLNYYQLKIGLFNEKNNIKYGFQLGLNLGNKFGQYSINEGNLYTDSLGKSITLNGDFEVNKIKKPSNIFELQGVGSCVDLYYEYYKPEKFLFRADLKNLGFIVWNKNGSQYNENTKFVFEGLNAENIFNFPTSKINIVDTVNDYLAKNSKKENQVMLTPMTLSFSYKYYINEKLNISAVLKQRFFSTYSTYFEISPEYIITNNILLTSPLSYGGYSKFNIGIGVKARIKDKFVIELQTRYLSGIFKKSFSGIGAFINLNYTI